MTKKWFIALFFGVLLAAVPSLALAQEEDKHDSFGLRIGDDIRVGVEESVGTVVAIDGNAYIDGEVDGNVVVIKGDAIVTGRVNGNLTVVSGNIDLRAGSQVENIFSIRGDLVRAEGSIVTGTIRERDNFAGLSALTAVFSVVFWAVMAFTAIVAGLIFAAVGGKQLNEAAHTMTEQPGQTSLGVLAVFIGLPTVAVLLLLSLIGIPVGLAILTLGMPLIWFLGYIVAGARLGSAIVGVKEGPTGIHPYAAVTTGIVILQLVALVPVLGTFVAFMAGVGGAGALACLTYRAVRSKGSQTGPTATTQAAPQAM